MSDGVIDTTKPNTSQTMADVITSTDMPEDGQMYVWDEDAKQWK